ncbi:hypothetical protein GCM10022218_12300 [Sphingobacterium ginsenosidimutans]|uniref:Bacteriocin n=1 Tax=Sphingobacterium ginsenosidimutans TaxID=687845 RepID=A0ABP7ZVW6_9SPHI
MKKINLKNFKTLSLEKLTKDDLKNVLGGSSAPVTSDCVNDPTCSTGCSKNKVCNYCCYA